MRTCREGGLHARVTDDSHSFTLRFEGMRTKGHDTPNAQREKGDVRRGEGSCPISVSRHFRFC